MSLGVLTHTGQSASVGTLVCTLARYYLVAVSTWLQRMQRNYYAFAPVQISGPSCILLAAAGQSPNERDRSRSFVVFARISVRQKQK